jgi:hypothetical protein
MGRVYAVTFENVAVSASQDLFEISPADDKPVRLLGLQLSNVGGVSDVGDASEELLRLTIKRGHSTGGSGGSAPTPAPLDPADTAAGFAAEVNNTTIASAGTAVTLFADGMNSRVPYQQFWTPETCPKAGQGNTTIVVRLEAAPADSINLSGVLFVEEL